MTRKELVRHRVPSLSCICWRIAESSTRRTIPSIDAQLKSRIISTVMGGKPIQKIAGVMRNMASWRWAIAARRQVNTLLDILCRTWHVLYIADDGCTDSTRRRSWRGQRYMTGCSSSVNEGIAGGSQQACWRKRKAAAQPLMR